jgi:hypothetical protein
VDACATRLGELLGDRDTTIDGSAATAAVDAALRVADVVPLVMDTGQAPVIAAAVPWVTVASKFAAVAWVTAVVDPVTSVLLSGLADDTGCKLPATTCPMRVADVGFAAPFDPTLAFDPPPEMTVTLRFPFVSDCNGAVCPFVRVGGVVLNVVVVPPPDDTTRSAPLVSRDKGLVCPLVYVGALVVTAP